MKVFEDRFPAGTQGTLKPGYYMDGTLKENLNILKGITKDDWDAVIAVDGIEGGGKSVLAQQIAYFCDPTMSLDRVVFTPEEFKKAVLNAKQFQAIIFDEAYGGLASRRAMTMTNIAIVDMLTEIRQLNLIIFIVLPTFFDLDKYVALWRSRALLHVYCDGFKRGYFKFYSYTKKKDMYVLGKKFYNYKCVKPDFVGRYTGFYPLDRVGYLKKKKESLRLKVRDAPKNLDRRDMMASVRKDIAIALSNREYAVKGKKFRFSQARIGELLGVNQRAVCSYLKIPENEPK